MPEKVERQTVHYTQSPLCPVGQQGRSVYATWSGRMVAPPISLLFRPVFYLIPCLRAGPGSVLRCPWWVSPGDNAPSHPRYGGRMTCDPSHPIPRHQSFVQTSHYEFLLCVLFMLFVSTCVRLNAKGTAVWPPMGFYLHFMLCPIRQLKPSIAEFELSRN